MGEECSSMAGSVHQKTKHVPGTALNEYTSWKWFYFTNHTFSLFYFSKVQSVQKMVQRWTSVIKNRDKVGGNLFA